MNLRVFNARFLEPASLWVMVIGVVALCQPWIAVLHAYSVLITLIGLIGFNIAAHIPAPEPEQDDDELAPGASVGLREGQRHG
jgi:hypothetical protein